jgi:hypothetical protein
MFIVKQQEATVARELKTTIEIDASVDAIWSVLIDFSRYSEWNPFIRSISGIPLSVQLVEALKKVRN